MSTAIETTQAEGNAGGWEIGRWTLFLFFAAMIGLLLVPTWRAKMAVADYCLGNTPGSASWVSRRHAELDLFYSQRPIFAAATDIVMFAVWVYSLSRFGPVRNDTRADWLRVLAAIMASMAIIGSLIVSQRHGPELGWKCFDSLFLVIGGTVFVIYLLMAGREWRLSGTEEMIPPSPLLRRPPPFVLRWADMLPIAVFLALVKDVLLLVLSSVFALDAPSQLVAAIRGNDSDTVRQMLARDPFLANCRLPVLDAGLRPAHLAVIFGHEEVLCRLLRGGADPDGKDDQGRTPLLWAAMADFDGQMTAALLDQGADGNLSDNEGQTPLIGAVRRGNLAAAQILIQRCVKVDAADVLGRTALHYAAESQQVDLVRLLVQANASKSIFDARQQTPLSLATATIRLPQTGGQTTALQNAWPEDRPAERTCLCTAPEKILEHTLAGQCQSVAAEHNRGDVSRIQELLGNAGM